MLVFITSKKLKKCIISSNKYKMHSINRKVIKMYKIDLKNLVNYNKNKKIKWLPICYQVPLHYYCYHHFNLIEYDYYC